MLQKLKHTIKHSFVYSLGNLAIKVVGIFLLPAYSDYLSTAEIGVWAVLETTAEFLVAIFSLNIANAMMRWWADAENEEDKKSYVFTTFAVLVFAGILMNLSLQPFATVFSEMFYQTKDFTVYFQILFLSVTFDMANKYFFSLIRILEKSTLYIFVNVAKLIVVLSLTLYFIINLQLGVKGIILAQLIGHALGFVLLLPLLFKNIIFKFQINVLGKMLSYSIPLAFTALSGVLFRMGDRYVIKFLADDARVGVYHLATKVSGLLNFFILQSFQMAFLPIAYKMYKEPNAKRFFSKVFTYLAVGLTFGALGLSLFAEEFFKIFASGNEDFWEAAKFVPLLTVSVVLLGIRYMLSLNFRFAKRTIMLAAYVSVFSIVNILLNLVLVPKIDVYGAILSSIIVSFVLNIFYYYSGRKLFYVKYEIGKIIIAFIIAVLLYSISFLIVDFNFILKLTIKISLIVVFPVILYFTGFLEQIEKQRIKESIKKWKNIKNFKSNLKN